MQIRIHFQVTCNKTGALLGFEHVADIVVPAKPADEVEHWLEHAFALTQNRMGSWSRGPKLIEDGALVDNPDYNACIERIAALKVFDDGRVYGLRSSMSGDVFEVDGVFHRVVTIGFDPMQVEGGRLPLARL